MTLPDPYANEPTTEVPRDLVRQWVQARDNAAHWEKEKQRLQGELALIVGDAHAGTLDGEKVFTYRPMDRYAEARIIKENPDLAQHYIKPTVVDKFDLPAFLAQHPDIAAKYQSRQFRAAE